MASKTLVTVGTIHNFSKQNVIKEHKKLLTKLTKKFTDELLVKQVNKLKNLYGINRNITSYEIDACDIELSGHGKYMKKINI